MFRYKQSLKVILSDKLVNLLLVAVFVYMEYRIIFMTIRSLGMSGRRIDIPLFFMLEYAYFYFLMFLYLSFETFYKVRRERMEETIESTSGGRGYAGLLTGLLGIHLILFGVILITVLLGMSRYINSTGECLWHGARLAVVTVFLPGTAAILAGCLLARIRSRWMGMLALVSVVIVTSGPFQERMESLSRGSFFRNGVELFGVLQTRANSVYFPLTGYSVTLHEWVHLFFWIGLLAAGVWFFYFKKQRVLVSGALLALAGLSFYFYLQPYADWKNIFYTGGNSAAEYYKHTLGEESQREFEITGYDIDFKIRSELIGKCTIRLSKDNLSSYDFTLYHTLKVSAVEDDKGEALDYRQEGDYITVFPKSGQPLEEVTIFYKGLPEEVYVDTESFCLYGTNPYYPRAGKQILYDFGLVPCKEEKAVPIRLTVDSRTQVYTNLFQTGENTYEGQSAGIFLMGGFVAQCSAGGATFYYPYPSALDYSPEALETLLEELGAMAREQGKSGYDFQGKKVFITEMRTMGGDCYYRYYEDYVEAVYYQSLEKGYKDYLQKTTDKEHAQ